MRIAPAVSKRYRCHHLQKEIEEQVIEAIKKLPTIEEKVQAIAMNTLLIEKRQLDEKMQNEINEIETNQRKKYQPLVDEVQTSIFRSTKLLVDNMILLMQTMKKQVLC